MNHLLAGDGGDELFAGNSRYARQHVFARYTRLPRLARLGVIEPLLRSTPGAMKLRPLRRASAFIGRANVPLPERLEIWNSCARGRQCAAGSSAIDAAAPWCECTVWDEALHEPAVASCFVAVHVADNDLRKVGPRSSPAMRVSSDAAHRRHRRVVAHAPQINCRRMRTSTRKQWLVSFDESSADQAWVGLPFSIMVATARGDSSG
jgi:hypothetical protein